MMSVQPTRRPPPRGLKHQGGVVLLFALIALAIMLVAAVALSRSFQTSLFAAGNLGFKRDLRNQSDLAVSKALAYFKTNGGLSTSALRAATPAAGSNNVNYSAVMLPTDPAGLPLILTDASFTTKFNGADIQSTVDTVTTIRYVIDRLCTAASEGFDEKTLGVNSCVLSNNSIPPGQNLLELKNADSNPLCATCQSSTPQAVVYRLSIWVRGPRNTQSFFQSTFNVPS